jgi:hypothetical protein
MKDHKQPETAINKEEVKKYGLYGLAGVGILAIIVGLVNVFIGKGNRSMINKLSRWFDQKNKG